MNTLFSLYVILILSFISFTLSSATCDNLQYILVGNVTASSATLVLRWLDNAETPPSSFRILLRRLNDFSGVDFTSRPLVDESTATRSTNSIAIESVDARMVVRYQLTELRENSAFITGFMVDDELCALHGSFRTRPLSNRSPFSFRVIAASCATTGSTHPIFSSISKALRGQLPHEEAAAAAWSGGAAPGPMMNFFQIGDIHYGDISEESTDLFIDAFDGVFANREQQRAYMSSSLNYVWDDHDSGPNDNFGATNKALPHAQEAYRRIIPHPTFPSDSAIYASTRIGRVLFILSDLRSESDADKRVLMGDEQVQWFKDEINTALLPHSSVRQIIWFSSVSWIGEPKDTVGDDWPSNSGQRTELASFLANAFKNSTVKLMLVHGDAHMSAADTGENNRYAFDSTDNTFSFPVVCAGPLDRSPSVKGGPYNLGCSLERGQFVVLDIRDVSSSEDVCVEARVWDSHSSDTEKVPRLNTCDLNANDDDGGRSLRAPPSSCSSSSATWAKIDEYRAEILLVAMILLLICFAVCVWCVMKSRKI